MSTDFPPAPPSNDARIRALERLTTTLNAQYEQLSLDMLNSFRQAALYQEHRFNLIDEQFASLEKQITDAKNEILGAFNGLLEVLKNTGAPGPGQES